MFSHLLLVSRSCSDVVGTHRTFLRTFCLSSVQGRDHLEPSHRAEGHCGRCGEDLSICPTCLRLSEDRPACSDGKDGRPSGRGETPDQKVHTSPKMTNTPSPSEPCVNFLCCLRVTSSQPGVCPAEPLDSEDVLFLLYSSGSTGKPQGIVQPSGLPAVRLHHSPGMPPVFEPNRGGELLVPHGARTL